MYGIQYECRIPPLLLNSDVHLSIIGLYTEIFGLTYNSVIFS